MALNLHPLHIGMTRTGELYLTSLSMNMQYDWNTEKRMIMIMIVQWLKPFDGRNGSEQCVGNWGLEGQFSNKLEVLGNLHRELDWIKLANARIRSGLLWTVQSVNGSLIASRIYTALNQMEWIKSCVYILSEVFLWGRGESVSHIIT